MVIIALTQWPGFVTTAGRLYKWRGRQSSLFNDFFISRDEIYAYVIYPALHGVNQLSRKLITAVKHFMPDVQLASVKSRRIAKIWWKIWCLKHWLTLRLAYDFIRPNECIYNFIWTRWCVHEFVFSWAHLVLHIICSILYVIMSSRRAVQRIPRPLYSYS